MYLKTLLKTTMMTTVLLSGQVHAQSLIETTIGDINSRIMDYTKEHFEASYHGEFYAVRRDIESPEIKNQGMNDFKMLHIPTLIYKPSKNWQVLATGEFSFSDQPAADAGADYPNGFYRALFTLTRKNILSEKENGIQLDAGIGRRQYNTGSQQRAGGIFAVASFGSDRVFTTVKKTFGKSNASLFLQYMNNDYKVLNEKTWKNALEIIPTINLQITDRLSYIFNDDIIMNTPKSNNTARNVSIIHDMNLAVFNFQWNDKISTYYQTKYEHRENFTKDFQKQDDYFLHYAGVAYAFTPKATVTMEVGSETFHARDGRDFLSKRVAYPELAMYLDVAI
jgi:hypothetical protein